MKPFMKSKKRFEVRQTRSSFWLNGGCGVLLAANDSKPFSAPSLELDCLSNTMFSHSVLLNIVKHNRILARGVFKALPFSSTKDNYQWLRVKPLASIFPFLNLQYILEANISTQKMFTKHNLMVPLHFHNDHCLLIFQVHFQTVITLKCFHI